MKPAHIKEQRLKEVLRIHQRHWDIGKERRALGYIKLEKPIRYGWFKELVITYRVERFKNAKYIMEVYEKMEKCLWGRTKEAAEKRWQSQTLKHYIRNDVPTLSRRQYNKLSDGAQRLCVPFVHRIERKKVRIHYYVKMPKGTYRVKFTRAYITHSKRIDSILESEASLLDQQLEKRGYYEIDQKMNQWKYDWDWKDEKIERKKKRDVQNLKRYSIDQIINEEISWEKN